MKRLVVVVFLVFLAAPQYGLGQASPADLLKESKELNQKAASLFGAGRLNEAEPLLKRALEIREKILDADHPDVAESLNNLARLYQTMGRYEYVEPLLMRSLTIRQKSLGRDHASVSMSLNNLAYFYIVTGRYGEAEPLLKRSLEINEKTFGRDSAAVATSLNNLSALFADTGRYAEAEALLKRSLEIRQKTLGKDHPDVATSLSNLAGIYWKSGRYAEAEPLIKAAVQISRKAFGREHRNYATALNNLGELYNATGRYPEAERFLKESLGIREKTLGKDHPDVAASLNNLAGTYWSRRLYARAEPLMERALEIAEKAYGKEHPRVATALNNLAELYSSIERYREAEPLFRRSLEITERHVGKDHADVATVLNNLAELYRFTGRYTDAEPLYKRSIALLEKNFGDSHPRLASALNNLARLYAAKGLDDEAHSLFTRSSLVGDRIKEDTFLILPEKQKLQYVRQNTYRIETFISHTAAHMTAKPSSVENAFNAWIRWKGSVLEAQGRHIDALATSNDPKVQELLTELSKVRRETARLQISGPGSSTIDDHKKKIASLERKKQVLEDRLMAASVDFLREKKAQKADVKAVAAAMSRDAVYLDYAKVRRYDFAKSKKAFGPARYFLFVLIPGDVPLTRLLDLGPADEIDSHINAYLKEMARARTEGTEPDKNRLAKEALFLYDLLIKPAETLIAGKKNLIISPDGELNLVPFEVFTEPAGTYLLQNHCISYVGAGRDMMKFSASRLAGGTSLILADPDYDMGRNDMEKAKDLMDIRKVRLRAVISRDATDMHFDRLPDTRREADAVAAILRREFNHRVLNHQDRKALEDVLFSVSSPKVLHLATHGYFLAREDAKQADDTGDESITTDQVRTPFASSENPMLRSGLVLAGVNTSLREGRDDGVVTAEKVLGLKLRGTGLVVLSACETGVGDIRNSEGVFGLKRAFTLSGADSLLMSLWSVPSAETVGLITSFYTLLAEGLPKAAALRQAKLSLMEKKPNPFFWGGFVLTGEP